VAEATPRRKIRIQLSAQAERYARRDAPLEARLMAARGALPLPPVELATVLFVLLHDPEAEVKDRARRSLEELPENVCQAVLSGDAHPALLSWLARAVREDEAKLEALALNPATDDATYAFLAAQPFRRVVDVVSNNQERIARCPDIVEALGSNPLTGRATIDRILSFLGVEPGESPDAEPPELSEEQAEAALRALLGEEHAHAAADLAHEREDEEVSEERKLNLYALIQTLSVFQKIKLGRMGNKEARGLLVRDRNKVVALAAATSPKLTPQEALAFAQSRNVCDDVLRTIGQNRDWTRSYAVKLALATNPKCPQTIAVKFVNYLQQRDLWQIAKSKDVPVQIATHARRALMRKGKI